MGDRSRFRRRKDVVLLRRYARVQFFAAKTRMAMQAGVPVKGIGHRDGERAAIRRGFVKLRRWFDGLSQPEQDMTREKIQETLERAC